jgi:probable rRNA maturation factor
MPRVLKVSPPKSLKVEVITKVRSPSWLVPFSKVALRLIRKQLLVSKLPRRERQTLAAAATLTLVFVTPDAIGKLNADFRGKNRPTDVLSFAPNEPGSLGELIVTMPLIRAQAKENAHSTRAELTYILLHGTLHLLGLDHGRKMFSVQDDVFEVLRDKWS